MVRFKDSQTAKNLLESCKRESDANMKFTMYYNVAEREGYTRAANIFKNIAENETTHSKVFARYLQGEYTMEEILQDMIYSPVYFGTTQANIIEAANGQSLGSNDRYSDYANKAYEEKFPEVAALFNMVSSVEKHQNYRLKELMNQISDQKYFKRDEIVRWLCAKCGYLYTGYSEPEYCPLCYAQKRYFETFDEGYLET